MRLNHFAESGNATTKRIMLFDTIWAEGDSHEEVLQVQAKKNERYYEHRSRTHGYDGRSFSLDKKEQAISNSSSWRQGYDNILSRGYKYGDDIPLFGEEGFSDALEDDQVYEPEYDRRNVKYAVGHLGAGVSIQDEDEEKTFEVMAEDRIYNKPNETKKGFPERCRGRGKGDPTFLLRSHSNNTDTEELYLKHMKKQLRLTRAECKKFKAESLRAKKQLEEAQAQSQLLKAALQRSTNEVEEVKKNWKESNERLAALNRKKDKENSERLAALNDKIAILEKWEEPSYLDASINTLKEEEIKEFEIQVESLEHKSAKLQKNIGETKIKIGVRKSQLEARTCTICYDNEKNTILDPCGHKFCQVCAATLRQCPFCKQRINKRIKVYG